MAQCRRKLAEQGLDGLKKTAPGPASKKTAEQKPIEKLDKENERLRKQIEVKDVYLTLQKKVLALLEAFEENES